MQRVGPEYKSSMKQPLRERSYMKVTIGMINQEAQENAVVRRSEKYTYYSDLWKPLNNYEADALYATGEQDFALADGSMRFLPESSDEVHLNAGIVSQDLLGSIRIDFPLPYDIKGLTIDFSRAYPVDFTVESDHHTHTVEGNALREYVTDAVFPEATYLLITPQRMVNGQGRLRVHKIMMGIGLVFDNRSIITADTTSFISPVMAELPTIDFTLTVDNRARAYDVENESSSINFLEPGQQIEILYGYESTPGSIEWLNGGVLKLTSWEADDSEMSFRAVDSIAGLEDTYYRGQYHPKGVSLYDLAKDVFQDAGTDPRDYWLDSYLRSVIVQNPVPVATHREALQLIANAGRCIFYQDREGKLYVKSSFIPDMTASSDNQEEYSKVSNILTPETKEKYASGMLDYARADGSFYFLPGDRQTGYVSHPISGADGYFTEPPSVTIDLEAGYTCFGLSIFFGGNPAEEFTITTYLDGARVNRYYYTNTGGVFVTDDEFQLFDTMVLSFEKTYPHNRIVLDYLSFGNVTDYKLEYGSDLLKTPKGIKNEKVREMQVLRTTYSTGEIRDLAKEVVETAIDGQDYTFYWQEAAYDIESSVGTIIDSSAYYATVRLPQKGEQEVVITGNVFTVSQNYVSKQLDPTGRVQKLENVLVSSRSHAEDLAGWVGDYMRADREYELEYRGDPRIEVNDLLYLENQYTENLAIRAYEHNLKFAGYLSGSIKARRDISVD